MAHGGVASALGASPSARASTDPLEGIDLLIFDKDGTLIEFHLM